MCDQKYLWYYELKRFTKIPHYSNLLLEAQRICKKFDTNELKSFVEKLLNQMKKYHDNCESDYDRVFFGEYAQAIHYLINLHICNGNEMQ